MALTKTLNKLSLLAVSALAIPCATAQEFKLYENPMWYIGASAGQTRAKIDNERIRITGVTSKSITKDEHDMGFKLYGGYQFNPNFAIEGGYFNLGTFGYAITTNPPGTLNDETKIQGVHLDLVGILPFTDKFSGFAKGGVTYAHVNDSFTGSIAPGLPNTNPSENKGNFKFGAGLKYQVTKSLAVRVEAERNKINDALGNRGDVDLFSVGLVYQFGGKGHKHPAKTHHAAHQPAPKAKVDPTAPAAPVPTNVSFEVDSLFDFNKSELKPGAREVLNDFSHKLQGVEFDHITVTAHTDRIGSHKYNMALSTRRAETVKNYLTEKEGIPADKIITIGVDGRDPVTKPGECKGEKVTPALIACLQPDRRVEVVVSGLK